MHVPKTGQKTLFDVELALPDQKVNRLVHSWAGSFREHVLPLLIEMEPSFAKFYSPDMGAPNKAIAILLGLLIIKENEDLTDAQVVERFEFDLQWHYALDVPSSAAHICPKTLYNFRQKLMTDNTLQKVFETLCDRLIEQWDIKTTRHRIDSTHIVSNMKILSRLQLFVKTIEQFLKRKKNRDRVSRLPKRFHERYLDREGYFCDSKSSEARRRLDQCARDLWWLIDHFRGNKEVERQKSYQLMKRLFEEQCVVDEEAEDEDGAPRISLKPPKEIDSDTLQSPSDPDATYSGHKGKGYQAQLGETCHPDNPFQVIDYVKVEGAHESDQNAAESFHENLKSRGHEPAETFADTGYISGPNIIEAEAQGVNLIGPMPGRDCEEDKLTAADFEFNAERSRVERCPAGHEPVDHKSSKTEGTINVCFDRAKCDECPMQNNCPTRKTRKHRIYTINSATAAGQQRRRQETTAEFKEAYKIRSGIEATNSHLKNERGMKRLRVRGSPAVMLSVVFKVIAENVSRMARHVLETVEAAQNAAVPAH